MWVTRLQAGVCTIMAFLKWDFSFIGVIGLVSLGLDYVYSYHGLCCMTGSPSAFRAFCCYIPQPAPKSNFFLFKSLIQ